MEISYVVNDGADIPTGSVGIEGIIREFFVQLHADRFDNLDEMGSFFERHKLPTLTQEEIGIEKCRYFSISIREIESEVQNPLTEKTPGPASFIGELSRV